MFIHSKEKVVRRDKIKCLAPQVMSGGDIERLPIATSKVFALKYWNICVFKC
jgi:hypothetical protein